MNANVFLRHMIYFPERGTTLVLTLLINIQTYFNSTLKMLTLCMLVPLHHAWLFFSASSFSMLPPSSLGVNCPSPLLGG
jgi:hypothetical protein